MLSSAVSYSGFADAIRVFRSLRVITNALLYP